MTKGRDQYIIVMGPKGLGKTVLVHSATATCRVVNVKVAAGLAIVKPPFLDIFDPAPAALWVLQFYKLFSAFSRQAPTIVFHLKEQLHN
jgi:hypothetical protein